MIVKTVKKHLDLERGGTLTAIEPMELFPIFPGLKRFYFIASEPSIKKARAGHYHKIKKEAMFAVQGQILISLKKGEQEENFLLKNEPDDLEISVVYVPPGWWHEVSVFSEDAILGVLASTTYKEDMETQDNFEEIP